MKRSDPDYPEPASAGVSAAMRGNRKRDTRPEARLRSELHRRGLRFRKHLLLRLPALTVRPDITFPKKRLVVFVDGCFWHDCPLHANLPNRNRNYWLPKLQRNTERDRLATQALASAGWTVLRFWEHEEVPAVADRVEEAVRAVVRVAR